MIVLYDHVGMRRLVVFLAVAAILWGGAEAEAARRRGKGKTKTQLRRARPGLEHGVRLPKVGEGYRIPDTWANRGLSWGTRDLVSLVQRAAKRVSKEAPGGTLYVADLSLRRGGPSAWHKSHRTGRDVDLLFFALDDEGNPAPAPRRMISYDPDGVSEDGRLRFDTARNWQLVKALITDSSARVRVVFIAEPLEELLLDHAAANGERDWLLRRAAAILHQPGDSAPHDDHMHVRIDAGKAKAKAKSAAKTKTTTKAKARAKQKQKVKLKGKGKGKARKLRS